MNPSSQGPQQHADYHGHPNYVRTWAVLVAILLVSLALSSLGLGRVAVVMIFGLALLKAVLVMGNFMHMRWEPRLLLLFVVFGVLCLGFFYFGVLPDIVYVPQRLAR